jgi:diaminopimelate epimerase
MGNPHAVVFVESAERAEVRRLGPLIEAHPRFAKRTNVEFVERVDAQTLNVRVWERGAGITQACGTGACAAAVTALATGRVRGRVEVSLPGGSLWIRWDQGGPVLMEGPAEEVFRGEFYL